MGHSRLSYGGSDSNTRRRAKDVICSGSLQGGKVVSVSNTSPAEGKENWAGLSSVRTNGSSTSVEDKGSSSSCLQGVAAR